MISHHVEQPPDPLDGVLDYILEVNVVNHLRKYVRKSDRSFQRSGAHTAIASHVDLQYLELVRKPQLIKEDRED